MKFFLQANKTKSGMTERFQFRFDVDTKGGIEPYAFIKPPMDGRKYDNATKKFAAMTAADTTARYTEFEADQSKKWYEPKEWRIVSSWAVKESPADDDIPDWPGPPPELPAMP